MQSTILLEIAIILLLISANGVFAMSELAIVSARKPRLQQWADKGDGRAARALAIAEAPDDFLSTVQIGITLIGIVAGVFGGATLAQDLALVLEAAGMTTTLSDALSVAVVVTIITYLSLVVGELVPKNVALQNPERIAVLVTPFMYRLSRIVYPFVRLLSASTRLLVRLLGIRPSDEPSVSDEEIAIMLEQGAEVGVFEPEEPEIVRRIFRLSDRSVSSLMTPRREIVWLDLSDDIDVVRHKVAQTGFSRFPVADGNLEQVMGVVSVKDLLQQSIHGGEFNPRAILTPPLFVPESMPALELLARIKEEHTHMAMVFDEYGGLEGLVTSTDLLEAIVGDIDSPAVALIVEREDGSLLVDGMMPIIELLARLDLEDAEALIDGSYQTVGGFVLALTRGVPSEGDHFAWHGFHFEVMDMDGLRVDKVLVSAVTEPPADAASAQANRD